MIIPKILAIYLPQFYENEDNNEWWGKGFTDWESVKTAQKYFQNIMNQGFLTMIIIMT